MYDIITEDVPCWYELSWQEKPAALIIRLHRDIMAQTKWPTIESPVVLSYQSAYAFGRFEPDVTKGFGFDGAFVTVPSKDTEWITLRGCVPTMVTGKKTCADCRGTGVHRLLKWTCIRCDGTGQERVMSWQALDAFSASCVVLFGCPLLLFRGQSSAPKPQLLTIRCILQSGMHGASMGGYMSTALIQWCKTLENGALGQPTRAMQVASRRLFERVGKPELQEIVFSVHNGTIRAACLGNATEIHPEWPKEQVHEGYAFTSHNVDNAWQQVTFLAGLAALHDLARNAGI